VARPGNFCGFLALGFLQAAAGDSGTLREFRYGRPSELCASPATDWMTDETKSNNLQHF
jgi:hypothetical protein